MVQRPVQAAVVAQVGLFVAGQAIIPQPALLVSRKLVDAAEQTSPDFFDFAYENALDNDRFHLADPVFDSGQALD
ncbi:hypothetical protein D3C78_1421710 [compost metagenome]